MGLISKPYTFTANTTIVASENNSNLDTLYNLVNGNIDNANIKDGAAIADTKLAQITSASKTHGSSLTGLASIVSGAGVIPATNLTSVMPSGGIILWSGSIATIPSGWYLCDGNNGTPNLTNRFIVCADADDGGVAKSTITGSALQSHNTGISPAHTHTLNTRWNDDIGATYGNVRSVAGAAEGTATTSSSGTGTKVIPVFYALAYIMKA